MLSGKKPLLGAALHYCKKQAAKCEDACFFQLVEILKKSFFEQTLTRFGNFRSYPIIVTMAIDLSLNSKVKLIRFLQNLAQKKGRSLNFLSTISITSKINSLGVAAYLQLAALLPRR